MTVADRFRIVIGYAGNPSLPDVARAAKRPHAQHLMLILEQRIASPRLSSIEPYASALGCDAAWLLHGVGKAPRARDVQTAWSAAWSAFEASRFTP